jgi:hypothetical protein
MAAQVALRRQQAQEEAEARELGIRLLRTEADMENDTESQFQPQALELHENPETRGESQMLGFDKAAAVAAATVTERNIKSGSKRKSKSG